jgi:thiol-disulfide isomerase/thioredoxin
LIAITIYTRPGCHLCDQMKETVGRVVKQTRTAARIDEINIAEDPALEALYGLEIPVLLVNGKKAAKYRISEMDFARVLRTRAGGTE